MGEIYVSQHKQTALKAINLRELERLIDQAVRSEHTTALYELHLYSCGSFIAERLRSLEESLAEHAKSKALKKRAETISQALRAGSDLLNAVHGMQDRIESEAKETQLFRIDELVTPPYLSGKRVDVFLSYQWRRATDDDWTYHSIKFVHDVDTRPHYTVAAPKRKPSVAKQERDHQEELYKHWEHLRRLAIHSVREYLRLGGDGNATPEIFLAKTDPHSRWLNNFSCDFWRERS